MRKLEATHLSGYALTSLTFPFTMGGMATETRIGTTIKRARERKRWSQRQLAAALGVDRKSIDNWEHDRTYPRSSIGALEEVLGIRLGGEPAAAELAPEDDWEAAVLTDRDLPPEMKRALIQDSRAARAAYDAARRARRQRRAEAEEAAGRPGAAPYRTG
jgi:transcriptional regulator with XRE-family HTH domain